MPTIAAIIPTYNEEKYLGLLLGDLHAQADKPDEIIVADCNSTDSTVKIAKEYRAKVVKTAAHKAGVARNAGAKAAKSDYLLFIDADMRIPANLIAEIRSTLQEQAPGVITPAFVSDGTNATNNLLMFLVGLEMKRSFAMGRLYLIGGVMCVKKAVHERIGGFRETMRTEEDIDYAKRLRKAKATYVFLSHVKTVCSGRRYKNKSLPRGVLQLFAENFPGSRWLLQPVLGKVGKARKYGHY